MPLGPTVLARHDPCPWLPEGGAAEVVLTHRMVEPERTAVVRMLVTADDHVLVANRADGEGWDIPSAKVTEEVESCLARLSSSWLSDSVRLELVGYVHNQVPKNHSTYPWPTPDAYFCVWHGRARREVALAGRWLHRSEAEEHLGQRHWWPLAAAVLG